LPAEAQQGEPPGAGLEVYVGEVDAAGIETMREMGLDADSFIVEQEAGGTTQVEAFQGTGVFLDDVSVLADGATVAETSFELDLGGWTASGSPEGSVDNVNDWIRTQLGFEEGAVTTTEDTVFAGFGFEGLAQDERDDLMARVMSHLLP
jgi:hypothetical protein